jgi:cell wall-associated NlpC family hydrolase
MDDLSKLRKKKAPPPQEKIKKPPPGRLESVAASYIGTPYRYGGTTRAGLDCSGFVGAVYREVYNKTIPRSSSAIWKEGKPVSRSAARPGDLVFFRGGSFGTIDHVGIYLSDDKFIHASTSRGVVYNNLNETYYSRRFAGIKRVI